MEQVRPPRLSAKNITKLANLSFLMHVMYTDILEILILLPLLAVLIACKPLPKKSSSEYHYLVRVSQYLEFKEFTQEENKWLSSGSLVNMCFSHHLS